MKICIFGAGAIGGFLGAELAASGADVSLIARGPHLEAMRAGGVRLIRDGETRTVQVACTDDPAEAGEQDAVVVTLKAHTAPAAVEAMRPLLGPETAVVTAVNGIPWWYFHGLDGPHADHRLESVDPGSRQWDGLGPERAIGCVVYPATEIVEPGVIRHVSGDRFTLGEPDGSRSERVTALAQAFSAAGLKAPVRPRIRDEIWMKLWGNVSFNPISVLTGATLEAICADADSRAVVRAMMVEARAVGEALGVRFALDVDKRIDGAARVGAHKTSMLQDFERRRSLEIEPMVGAVAEMARLVEVATPTVDAVLSLTRARARAAGIADA
jgi:2-dehydropantoate 2-reductase